MDGQGRRNPGSFGRRLEDALAETVPTNLPAIGPVNTNLGSKAFE
jgi:hypothetical protein